MVDPATLTAAIHNATKVANTPLFTTIIDKVTGFRLSKWAAEGELRKQMIHDEYEKAKENGLDGVIYIENLRKTSNLIETAVKSSKYIEEGKENEIKYDNDFFWNAIEHAKTISNEEMQEIIAKIIASEYNNPGSYSMGTLHILKMLGKIELELFQTLGSLCLDGSNIPKSIFSAQPDGTRPILQSMNIDFESLQTLQNYGLVLPNDMKYILENPERKIFEISYFDSRIEYQPVHETKTNINYPNYYKLSKTGEQILQHLDVSFNQDYYNWLIDNFKIANYEVVK